MNETKAASTSLVDCENGETRRSRRRRAAAGDALRTQPLGAREKASGANSVPRQPRRRAERPRREASRMEGDSEHISRRVYGRNDSPFASSVFRFSRVTFPARILPPAARTTRPSPPPWTPSVSSPSPRWIARAFARATAARRRASRDNRSPTRGRRGSTRIAVSFRSRGFPRRRDPRVCSRRTRRWSPRRSLRPRRVPRGARPRRRRRRPLFSRPRRTDASRPRTVAGRGAPPGRAACDPSPSAMGGGRARGGG